MDLKEQFKQYKEKGADMPVIYKNTEIFKEKERYKVILSEEVMDRDGEIVKVDGMQLPENGVPFIDGHDMSGSVITRRLGTVKNIRVEGNKVVGEIILVDTIKGNEVKKILDDKEHPFPVSMGFGVIDFDANTNEIKEWELFELSAVNVPSNIKARVLKQLEIEDFEKIKSHYKTIKAPMKEFTKSFLSDSFCKKVGYKKQGDLLLDVNGLFEVVCNKLKSEVETPQAKKTSKKLTTKTLSEKQVDALAEKIASVFIKSE